jgi:excisionase family DNA binding protein
VQETAKTAVVREAEPVLLSVADAARALGIGRTEIFMMIRRGDIGSVTIGRRRLIPLEELRKFAARKVSRAGER